MKSVPIQQWLTFAALSVLWGTTWIASDTLNESVPPLHGSAARFLLAAILCLPIILWKRLRLPRGRALRFTLLLSATMVALPLVLLLWAKQHVSSATMTVLFSAMPLLVALMTAVPRRALQAMIVGLGAMALVVGPSPSLAQAGGAGVALIAVASIGASSLVARRELSTVHPVVVTALLAATAAGILFLAGLAIERGQAAQWNYQALGSVIFLAAAAGAPAYAMYFWLLQQKEAYQVTTVQWIAPLVALSESALLRRQGLSLSMIAGSVVTLVCVLVVMQVPAEDDDTVSLLGN